jgi:hypothetical protein
VVEEERLSAEALARRTEVNEAEHPLWKCVGIGNRISLEPLREAGRSLLATYYSAAPLTGWLGIIGRVTSGGLSRQVNGSGLQD